MANERGGALFARATRAKVLPVMLAPVAVGATLAWERHGSFDWARFALTVLGAAAMHLGANVVNDVFDEETGAEARARGDHQSLATGSGVLGAGLMSRRALLGLAAALFAVGLACGVALAAAAGPWVLAFGAAGFLLAVEYVGPPLRYGYIGRGLGEAGIFVAFGLLPVAGAYYVQAERLDAGGPWASVVPGLSIMLVLYHHHFLHWRSDREARKMTPVAALGPVIGLLAGRIVLIAIVIVVALQSLVFGLYPPGAFAAALAAAPVAVAQRNAAADPGLDAYVRLLGASLGAAVLASATLVASSIVRVALR